MDKQVIVNHADDTRRPSQRRLRKLFFAGGLMAVMIGGPAIAKTEKGPPPENWSCTYVDKIGIKASCVGRSPFGSYYRQRYISGPKSHAPFNVSMAPSWKGCGVSCPLPQTGSVALEICGEVPNKRSCTGL
jgi:hypothetical protein